MRRRGRPGGTDCCVASCGRRLKRAWGTRPARTDRYSQGMPPPTESDATHARRLQWGGGRAAPDLASAHAGVVAVFFLQPLPFSKVPAVSKPRNLAMARCAVCQTRLGHEDGRCVPCKAVAVLQHFVHGPGLPAWAEAPAAALLHGTAEALEGPPSRSPSPPCRRSRSRERTRSRSPLFRRAAATRAARPPEPPLLPRRPPRGQPPCRSCPWFWRPCHPCHLCLRFRPFCRSIRR